MTYATCLISQQVRRIDELERQVDMLEAPAARQAA